MILTWEEMCTILAQVESCLNSRPLCPLTNDIEDVDALTPQHFLTGQTFWPLVENDFLSENKTLLKRWQICTQKYQEVCLRYKRDYIHRLQQRPKWLCPHENVKRGQLVLIKDDNLLHTSWPLGRVIEVHPGQDGIVRVVSIKTKNGIKTRPITKISTLPVECIDEESNPDES